MTKLPLHTPNLVHKNIEAVAALFPNTLTEVLRNGKTEYAIDFDALKQELSNVIVEGSEERYQFTWPDKKRSVLLANAPNYKTLRPCRSESVNFDTTENLYIEGDNLDVLKLLQETYLGRVKMIYIDPPYNTGKDFVYADDFKQSVDDYMALTEQYDEEGNRLVTNRETNGRYHTDWLNMIYPRLRLAKDLLKDDGVIFISIDDNEVHNLRKICDEVFGAWNFVAIVNWKGRGGRQDSKYYAAVHEYILVYAKNISSFQAGEEIKSGDGYSQYDEEKQRYYKTQLLRKWGSNSRREDRPNLYYPITAPDGSDVYPMLSGEAGSAHNLKNCGCWRHGASTMRKNIEEGRIEFKRQGNDAWIAYEKIFAPLDGEESTKKYTTWIEETNDGANVVKNLFASVVFDYPKTPTLVGKFLKMAGVGEDDIILDFFSGSATTAHALMQLNAEDGGNRKFIMVQIPEAIDENHEAYRAGYRTICDIGKERIRRAGAKISAEIKDQQLQTKLFDEEKKSVDIGFRVLKADSTNMKDVYHYPEEYNQAQLFSDNIKEDRTTEDLLFQVMLDLGIFLSSEIKVEIIDGKELFVVYQNSIAYLIACFDENITTEVVTAIAKRTPYYAVFRDSGIESDSVRISFEQIFAAYSKETVRKVI